MPPGDAGGLSLSIERILTEPGLAERCQAAGQRLVEETYSWDAIAGPTLATYRATGAGELAPPSAG